MCARVLQSDSQKVQSRQLSTRTLDGVDIISGNDCGFAEALFPGLPGWGPAAPSPVLIFLSPTMIRWNSYRAARSVEFAASRSQHPEAP